ncbi:histidine-rich glycoprotein-like [Hyposmocoma kahamanoa]|uniref:histidine-rich glycoprotein-like n=1 Tax=Hyposmocoma kahamanoa TaxID=1477025 RepID=UPI000E6D8F4C|nr:histidine-rich glycoprotein-like [Hyposmocoma kahamanoa]
MHTAVTLAFLFCLVAAYASALPAEPLNNDNVKEVAPVAVIEDQEVLQGEESRWGHGGYHHKHHGYHHGHHHGHHGHHGYHHGGHHWHHRGGYHKHG